MVIDMDNLMVSPFIISHQKKKKLYLLWTRYSYCNEFPDIFVKIFNGYNFWIILIQLLVL